jgi:predicted MFS family arabinose efflux permease
MVKKSGLTGLCLVLLSCFTSPCCTPLIVPALLALVEGKPAAMWISQHLGWIYDMLTIVSQRSFVLALRWMRQHQAIQPTADPSKSPDISSLAGGHVHVA